MGIHCIAYRCRNRQKKGSGVQFYRLPADKDRRDKWLAAIKRDNWVPTVYSRLCSEHFISGRKNNNPFSPDYVPSIFSSLSSQEKRRKKAQLERFNKRQQAIRQRYDNTKHQDVASAPMSLSVEKTPNVGAEFSDQSEDATSETESVQSDVTVSDSCSAEELNNRLAAEITKMRSMASEEGSGESAMIQGKELYELELQCQTLQTEVHELQARVESLSMSLQSFKDNDEKVKFYTGLSSANILEALFSQIEAHIHVTRDLSKFQQFLITLMRLRLNLSCQDLAFRFGVHLSTVSHVFQSCINTCHTVLVPVHVTWPDRRQQTLPASFQKCFSKCVSIIDCLEMFIERPSDLKARAQMQPSNKQHNTVKYLFSLTPQGTVNFISRGWGGRVSDKYIAENCGYLQNLNPGDLVLTQRGFNIQDTLAVYGATLETFTKGKKQPGVTDVETTRNIATVRTHVERVIGETRDRYTFLRRQIPVTMLLPDSVSDLTPLDKVVRVCCALIAANESVVPAV